MAAADAPGGVDSARADAAAREHALDVRRSFLVQAPAGSGKTGLLIQRMLALLANVERPEQILAMTFTRKAAAEMRERVLHALRDAQLATPVPPQGAHALRTRDLAQRVLARDARLDWQLRANPARLKIVTIDAVAASFARQAPIATRLGAMPAFVDDASAHYRDAALAALADAPAGDEAWRRFLTHLDNDAPAVVTLLAQMLARREQWRAGPPLGTADARLRAELEASMQAETAHVLRGLAAHFPHVLVHALPDLMRHAAANFPPDCDATFAVQMPGLLRQRGLPAADAEALPQWRALADWLLVKGESQWRAKVDKNQGFPPAEKPRPGPRAAAKAAMTQWLADASAVPGLAEALHAVRYLPPAHYDDHAWAFVAATLALLPQLAAHLMLEFARTGETDFSEATLRALTALGDADAPGDVLLAADMRITHILVDEFQDTSWTHNELLGRLTAGWEPGDGRTLFAVGDPMQSIYRFRAAEVGIFLAAQARGRINDVPVECLTLTRNFRSQATVVDWVNAVFPQVLGRRSDPARGVVAYEPVLSTRGGAADPVPTVTLFADAQDEAREVVRLVAEALAEGATDVAILVRARTQLGAILPALRRAQIAYTAVDVEPLAERLATRDLLVLTRALTQPADMLAGLALLRAPWCGLVLADLLIVAEAARGMPVLEAIATPAVREKLGADGCRRLERLRTALAPALAARGRVPLAQCVRAAWVALNGPACGEPDLDLNGAARFFAALATHERGGDVADWDALVEAAEKLYAVPAVTASVQVMTLHKAKGLEFDTVILPGLAAKSGQDDDPPLRWRVRERAGRGQALLVAPLHARAGAASAPDPVYRYLRMLDVAETEAELGRVLYVGCTRARRRLHLLAVPGVREESAGKPRRWAEPGKGSAWGRLWPALEGAALPAAPPASTAPSNGAPARAAPALLRLPLDWFPPDPATTLPAPAIVAAPAADAPVFDWAQATAAAVGTVAHRLLAQVAAEGLAVWTADHVAAQRARVIVELAAEGVDHAGREATAVRVIEVVTRTVADARGRWLFAADHEDGRSEFALGGVGAQGVEHVILDRTFVAEGYRWIVDFKTSAHEGGDAQAFLDREVDRYRPQLERYARIMQALDPLPLMLALYFPLVEGGWRAWRYEPDDARAVDAEIR